MKFSFHNHYVKGSYDFKLDGNFESYADPLFPDFDVKNDFKNYITPEIDYRLEELGLIVKPKSEGFPIFLTHDIDYLDALNLEGRIKKLLSKESLINKKIKIFLGMCRDCLFQKKFRTYEELVSLNIEKKRIATYFMVSDEVISRSVHDAFYKLHKNLDFSSEFFNVGIHGQWQSHCSQDALNFELNRLKLFFKKPISSCRYHHLFFNKDITPAVQLKSSIKFDFTLGFNMINGYRRKSAIPIVVENDFGKIIQIPTLYQDLVELRHGVMDTLDPFKAIDHCSKFGFPFSLLWHNCWEPDSKEERRIESILEYAVDRGGFFTTPEDFFGSLYE